MIRFEPLPGKAQVFRKELVRVCENSRAEPGCVGLDVFESLREPVTFAIHSEWSDEAAYDRHAKLPHTRRFVRATEKLLSHPIRGLRLRKLGDGGSAKAMQERSGAVLGEIRDVLLETYAVNDAMNQLLLTHLDPRAWRAQPPEAPSGKKHRGGRTIAAIFAHLHNCRLRWLKNSAPHLKCPAPLDPHRCTMRQAAAAHKKSAEQCLRMLTEALSGEPKRRVTKFFRDSWMPIWPAGGAMFCYMFSHEAHHRGQILMLAHQLGYQLPDEARGGIWWWDKLWKQRRFAKRPR